MFSEASTDGGATWIPASNSFRIEQIPEPTTTWLLSIGYIGVWAAMIGRKWRAARAGAAE